MLAKTATFLWTGPREQKAQARLQSTRDVFVARYFRSDGACFCKAQKGTSLISNAAVHFLYVEQPDNIALSPTLLQCDWSRPRLFVAVRWFG
jgi:hypothetical protein